MLVPLMAHLSSSQSVRQALGVCVEVWVAVRAKALDWVTESVCATPATRETCARAAPTATSERKAPTAASVPVQVRQVIIMIVRFSVCSITNQLSPSPHRSPTPAPPPPPHSHHAACYHSCRKCSGPEDYKCLDCKAGWMLHDNKCVGECARWVRIRVSVCVGLCVCCLADFVCLLDIDECGTELARCPSNTYCHNTDGSYECKGMIG